MPEAEKEQNSAAKRYRHRGDGNKRGESGTGAQESHDQPKGTEGRQHAQQGKQQKSILFE
jgi:hypothetical protein